MKHALVVAHRLAWPKATGIGRYARELCLALDDVGPASGWRTSVASAPETEQPTWLPESIPRHQLGRHRRITHLRWALGVGQPVERWTGAHDVVHVLNAFGPVSSRAPQIWTVHDLFPMLRPEWFGRVERWAAERALAHVRERAAAVISPSQTTARDLEVHLGVSPERVHVVYEGVSDEFRRPIDEAERRRVCAGHGVRDGAFLLALGGVSARKNLTVIADALQRTDATGEHPELLVVGPQGKGAADVLAQLGALGSRVRIGGYATDADVPVLLASAVALVHPSREEGFGLVPIEAMAAGTPVLAGDALSVREMTGGAAHLIGVDDADSWAAAIGRLREDPDWRSRLVADGRRRADAFTWAKAADATVAVYEAVKRETP